jgi:hypothetical protein
VSQSVSPRFKTGWPPRRLKPPGLVLNP